MEKEKVLEALDLLERIVEEAGLYGEAKEQAEEAVQILLSYINQK